MHKKFVTELKHFIKNNEFIEGKDFISVDTDEYYVLLPFVFDILHHFGMYEGNGIDFHISEIDYKVLPHCVTNKKYYFKNYYDEQFIGRGRIKCFFFNKKTKIADIKKHNCEYVSNIIMDKCDLWEFTCWLDENDEHIHLFHNCHNSFNTCVRDENIYINASEIIKKLKPYIFENVKKYNMEEIVKNYKYNIKK